MAKKRKTIRIDGDRNADWIKSLPGHKDEVAIHDALANKFKKEKEIEEGGPGSGWFAPPKGTHVRAERTRIVDTTEWWEDEELKDKIPAKLLVVLHGVEGVIPVYATEVRQAIEAGPDAIDALIKRLEDAWEAAAAVGF